VRKETVPGPSIDAQAPIAEREGFCRFKRARISQFGWRYRLPGRFGCSSTSRLAVRNRAISVALRRLNRIFPKSAPARPRYLSKPTNNPAQAPTAAGGCRVSQVPGPLVFLLIDSPFLRLVSTLQLLFHQLQPHGVVEVRILSGYCRERFLGNIPYPIVGVPVVS